MEQNVELPTRNHDARVHCCATQQETDCMTDAKTKKFLLMENLPDPNQEQDGIPTALMSSPIGIYIVQDRKFSFSNSRFQDIAGLTEEELGNRHPLDLVLAEDRDRVRESAIQMLRGQRSAPYRFRILDKKGNLRWLMETVAPTLYNGRRAVVGNCMEVTEAAQTEEMLRESEKKYRSLFELAYEGIAIVSYAEGNILDANQEFMQLTECDLESLRKKKIWETQPPEFQEEARETFFHFRETNGGIASWKLYRHKMDSILFVKIFTQRMAIDEEKIILCTLRNTDEQEAIKALRTASAEWSKSFDAIHDAVLFINPDFRINHANLAAARLLQMDAHHIVGERCYKLLHGTDIPPKYCPFLRAQAKGVYCEAESKEPHLGRTLQFSVSPMKNGQGNITYAVAVISDVTTRRREEEESVNLKLKLADSFQGITEALSGMVESRDPYTAGHSRHVAELAVLIGKQMGLSEEDLRGLRICALLHDIGKVVIPGAILNRPSKLSEHELGLVRSHPATAYEALRHIPFPWPVAEVVYHHHERLDGSGYPQGLSGEEIHLWARIISVADVMDAMTSHRPYRPSLPRRDAFEEFEKGRGTIYDPNILDSFMKVFRKYQKRVLIADNDPKVVKSLLKEFIMDGIEAEGYMKSALALQAFARKPFPVVITEMKMSGIDGIRLIEEIKGINEGTEVIVLTENGEKEDMLEALRAGASDFFEKPVDLSILIKSVKRALQRYSGKIMYTLDTCNKTIHPPEREK